MAKESFIPTEPGDDERPWIIPFAPLAYSPEEEAFRVRKSKLGADFHFYQLATPWSDIAVLLRNEVNKFGIFYLAATKEEESRIISWQFQLLPWQEPFFPEWRGIKLIISND